VSLEYLGYLWLYTNIEEVGVEEGEKKKIQMMRALIKMMELVMKRMVIMILHHLHHRLV
jgi:hypothetical protein